jgi:hypothetical protein
MAWFLSITPQLNPLLSSIRHSARSLLHCCQTSLPSSTLSLAEPPNHAELSAWVLLAERPISLVVDEAVLPGSVESLPYRNPHAFELRLSRGARRGYGCSKICKESIRRHRIKAIPHSKTRTWRASTLCSYSYSTTAKQCQTDT